METTETSNKTTQITMNKVIKTTSTKETKVEDKLQDKEELATKKDKETKSK